MNKIHPLLWLVIVGLLISFWLWAGGLCHASVNTDCMHICMSEQMSATMGWRQDGSPIKNNANESTPFCRQECTDNVQALPVMPKTNDGFTSEERRDIENIVVELLIAHQQSGANSGREDVNLMTRQAYEQAAQVIRERRALDATGKR